MKDFLPVGIGIFFQAHFILVPSGKGSRYDQ
jgi:hypothetical protein